MRIISSWFVVRGSSPSGRLRFASLWFVLLLCLLPSALLYSQDDYLEVKGNTKVDTLTFSTFAGDTGGLPSTPVRGEIFYNFAVASRQPQYHNGTAWQQFIGGQDRVVASRIVAASNSLDTTRADYVCPTGGTADQTEIQKAINDLSATGGAVYLLEGTYNISDAINLQSNTALIGTGVGTILRAVSDLGPPLNGVIKASNASGILISQLMIDGNSKTGSDNNGIYFNQVSNSKINKVSVQLMSGYGIYLNASGNNIICGNQIRDNCSASLTDPAGINLYNSSNNNLISQNIIRSNRGWGMHVWKNSNNNIVYANITELNRGPGIRFYAGSNNNIAFANNNLLNGSSGIWLCRTENNIIYNNNNYDTDNGIILDIDAKNNVIFGNSISANDRYGIWLQATSCTNNIISGNVINENGGGGNFAGIRFQGVDNDRNVISFNRILDSQPNGSSDTNYGIQIQEATSDNNYLIGNFIDGAGYVGANYDRRIADAGTGTKYTDKIKMTLERAPLLTVDNNSTLTPASPTSYQPVAGDGGAVNTNALVPIAPGKAAGDLLILEGTDNTNTVKVRNLRPSNVRLGLAIGGDRTLGQNDTLKLIWNGSNWLEMDFANNN